MLTSLFRTLGNTDRTDLFLLTGMTIWTAVQVAHMVHSPTWNQASVLFVCAFLYILLYAHVRLGQVLHDIREQQTSEKPANDGVEALNEALDHQVNINDARNAR